MDHTVSVVLSCPDGDSVVGSVVCSPSHMLTLLTSYWIQHSAVSAVLQQYQLGCPLSSKTDSPIVPGPRPGQHRPTLGYQADIGQ